MENQTFSLIDGTFSNQEAKEIVMNLYSNKINFHERKNFSSNECFGKDDLVAIKRIPQLKEALKAILELMKTAEGQNKTFVIKSTVSITISNS